ncbi:nuclear transport factor 2 family protein [Chromobacterium sp. IIBBL 290-4]|uniref:nuclear transport factor 2 family protein n=1 Tax=Chromobacterium sp. IIBBL 290-4 TaxID=2953890 RepID=UPI0020B70F97|nr:nuclear transport factor 2 family protein [Chromobacterium sp. IIBBL 290-4]UTH74624.1 nuclear transport factor 2 family protein [Chromobacterium sp. IIBBL 290-4]
MSDILTVLLEQETMVWQALRDGDAQADQRCLADEFLGVYASGFSDKAGHAAQLANGPTVAFFQLSQARAIHLGPDCWLLSYLAEWRRPGQSAAQRTLISSIWKQEETWRNLFSQDTDMATNA